VSGVKVYVLRGGGILLSDFAGRTRIVSTPEIADGASFDDSLQVLRSFVDRVVFAHAELITPIDEKDKGPPA